MVSPNNPREHDHRGQTNPSPSKGSPTRRSSRSRKRVERFEFNKAHGYSTVKRYLSNIVMTCMTLTATAHTSQLNANYLHA